jgi:hypothetical protein
MALPTLTGSCWDEPLLVFPGKAIGISITAFREHQQLKYSFFVDRS